MTHDSDKPVEITDDALDAANGGAKTKDAVRNAGLQSDGELVQARKAPGGTQFWDTLPPD